MSCLRKLESLLLGCGMPYAREIRDIIKVLLRTLAAAPVISADAVAGPEFFAYTRTGAGQDATAKGR